MIDVSHFFPGPNNASIPCPANIDAQTASDRTPCRFPVATSPREADWS
jgi:hypothetical protein